MQNEITPTNENWEKEFDEKWDNVMSSQSHDIFRNMKISIKLIVSACVSLEKKALLDRVADFFRAEYGYKGEYIEPIKPSHGVCCCCRDCGQYHDDCVCESNRIHDLLTNLRKDI